MFLWLRQLFLIKFILKMFFEIPTIITASTKWVAVFNLKIPSWLLLHTKLSKVAPYFFILLEFKLWKIGFLVTVLLWRSFHAECLWDFFLDLNLYCLFISLFFFKKKFWEKLSILFWTFDKLVTFLQIWI